ncbi:MAG TPA: hypothetical protein VFQ35_28690 [Polyangiaceae bacterium]|nr:hypothetical protein [Polyangiaceae bacterium]
MAIVSALLSALARRLGSLVQALFGWSVTALFGRLPRARQAAVSATLLLSAAWPLLLIGTVFPAVAAWALAFVPLHKWMNDDVLRIVWAALALAVPLVVGSLTRYAAESRSLRGGKLRSVLAGYALTLGYFLALLITLVTVPLAKLASLARRWDDDHIYVRPREGDYRDAVRSVAEAFALCGLVPEKQAIPPRMSLASRVLKWFAKSSLHPILPEEPQRLVAVGIEAYLYPADLMIRGEQRRLSQLRAMLSRTELERYAYLVESAVAQRMQDELARLWGVWRMHAFPDQAAPRLSQRLLEIYRELNAAEVPYQDWVVLERLLRKFERALAGGPGVLDAEQDGLERAKRAALEIETTLREREQAMTHEPA